MQLKFYTPSYGVDDATFGAATFGFVGAEDETDAQVIAFGNQLQGVMIHGTYEECLAQIPQGNWQVGIVLLGNAGDENAFVHRLAQVVQAPLVGGGAAIDPKTGQTALLTGKSQAAILLIDDARYTFEVCCENIHHEILGKHTVTYTSSRVLDTIDGQPAADWLRIQKEKHSIAVDDFEHLTLTDANGFNAHLSMKDGKICSGRDLQQTMYLRYVSKDDVFARMQAFYDDDDAIIFGCAGLKGILPKNVQTKGVGLFMFGEVCTQDGVSEFANLMLSKLRVKKHS